MTIDERLDKLTERHEALAQSLEILTHNVEDLRLSVENLGETVRVSSDRTDSKILALLTLAGIHQKRLDDIQGQSGEGRQ